MCFFLQDDPKRLDFSLPNTAFLTLLYQIIKTIQDKGFQTILQVFTRISAQCRIRHSSITTVLDKNNGNYRATQRFSRHAKPDTVMKYDDNRQKLQKQMTDILADLV